jgi:hypothetical protein
MGHNLKARIMEPATWHIVTATPGRERAAAAQLARRGFGVYVPTPELMGYLFAFVWADDIHKLPRCPGVGRVLTSPTGIPDADLHDLRAALAQLRNLRVAFHDATQPRGPKRRRRPRRSKR